MKANSNADERLRLIAKGYYIAKSRLIKEGYAAEVDWQYEVSLCHLNESTFLREAAWVILSSGMRETVIRQKFSSISAAFFDWTSAGQIVEYADMCTARAACHFRHQAKLDAIVTVAAHVSQQGFSRVIENVRDRGIEYLQQLPYMGPATSCHLAKNIGLPLSKPDRHLLRLANKLGYVNPHQLCVDIATVTDDAIPVIDIVLWRYSTLYSHYIDRFATLFPPTDIQTKFA